MAYGWLIGQYTGDPYKDVKITYSAAGSMTAASLCTVSVSGQVLSAVAMGTNDTTFVYATSSTTDYAGGTVVFAGPASEKFNYVIVHK